jgi:MurNAc alpha-1-phosphate uridylyltransferase
MLLAAGRGERMRPLTLETPKPLLRVGGRALIDWHLERLADAGVSDAVINVSWLGEQIVEHCGPERAGIRLQFSREDEPLETAGGIVQALPLLGDDPFLVVNGDIWTDYDFAKLVTRSVRPASAHLVLVDNPEHNLAGDFSLEDQFEGPFEGHFDRQLEGCPEARLGAQALIERNNVTLTFAGVGLYHPGFFAGLEPGSRPLLPLFRQAIAERRLSGEHYAGRWTDVGTPGRLRLLDESLS